MNRLVYFIITILTIFTFVLVTTPSMAQRGGHGGMHRSGGGHGGMHRGHSGGHRSYSGGHRGYRGGHRGYRGGHRGYSGGHRSYRGGHRGYRGGHRGYRGGHRGYGYYRPYGYYGYYWSYLIPPLVFGALSYYQYQRPVYYTPYPRPVTQQVIIAPQAQTPTQPPQAQALPQGQVGTYQIIIKDKDGNPQTISIPKGQTVTVREGKDGQVQIIVVEPLSPQQAKPQGNPITGYNPDGSPRYKSSIPLNQSDPWGEVAL